MVLIENGKKIYVIKEGNKLMRWEVIPKKKLKGVKVIAKRSSSIS